jgi:hypothetical protein
VDEPEEVPMIFSREILPEPQLTKDGIELVAVDEKQLTTHVTQDKQAKTSKKLAEQRQRDKDSRFINRMEKDTSDYLDVRQKELKLFLEKKQQRSRDEFHVKKSVLNSEFSDSVDRLIAQVQR